jgi:hypothetical protein
MNRTAMARRIAAPRTYFHPAPHRFGEAVFQVSDDSRESGLDVEAAR